ncbi:sulfite exporter TauE/SafE family protein [Pseudodesulfovibrio piezophilus]|uniref:Probable membrane transporter protein n=1 Tax=Pseudodesulfovibrio piezophilus (strain DSM 21447 / JCM 15486 / C1TLV30) TaxID=1322246 RepID=M1WQX1_PSEP2|nr:sulfite exporter TauE/SafE family protein [Pseudodesulfovibrio piezophilus]CCH47932.1 conserved membrane protein of unknown function [Pseudodesulfovibrio piezophilus C1TLV30]
MRFAQQLYVSLREAARAHAQWDIEVSTSIIKDKRKMWLLVVMTALGLLGSLAFASDLDLPSMLGGKSAYTPAFYTTGIFVASIAIGLCAGLITGCIGAGGGFIITPALMSAGIKGILAVGTDLFHIFAKAIMGTAVHKKLGNVSVSLALAFLVGSGVGVLGGGVLNRLIYEANPVASDAFISVIYVVLLGFLGTYAMVDFLRLRKAGNKIDAHGGGQHNSGGLPAALQRAKIPPMITFDKDLMPGGKKISGWFVAACGLIVGFMAAIMGVGGGFLTFPMFVYVLGVSSFTTVGTDILQIIFTAGFAAISQYAIYGFIFYTLAMGMLLGSLVGIQIGAFVTKLVPGIYIRGFYAMAILAGFINRLFAMPGKLAEMKYIALNAQTALFLTNIGNWLFFIVIGVFAVWVILTFFTKINILREG